MWGPCSGAVAGRRPHWDCSPGPPGCKPEPSAQTLSSRAELRKMPVPHQQNRQCVHSDPTDRDRCVACLSALSHSKYSLGKEQGL